MAVAVAVAEAAEAATAEVAGKRCKARGERFLVLDENYGSTCTNFFYLQICKFYGI